MPSLKSFERLVDSLSKLPSVGHKSAERMAYSMLEWDEDDLLEFSSAVRDYKLHIHKCPVCGNYTEDDFCSICKDPERDQSKLMVVSYPKDVEAMEKSEGYQGLYHVLGGAISARRGKGIEDLSIDALIKRVEKGTFNEVILATNPDVDGETTALFISRKLSVYPVTVSRLAYGLQIGGTLDYTDGATLARALEGRRKI